MKAQDLKNSILQMAMEGKLVPQDPNDEPASVLLERIKEEKEQLIKEKKIKRNNKESFIFRKNNHFYEKVGKKGEEVCIDDEIPWVIPNNWEWCKLGFIGDWKSGSTPKRGESKYYENGSIPWLKTGDLNNGIITEIPEFITELALKETSVRLNPIGSVLIAMYGATIGKVGILNIEATTNQACCACIPFNGIFNKFLLYYLMSQNKRFNDMSEGGAQPNISRTKIVNYLFPLPPLEEQHRIVNQIESILPLIDEYGDLNNKLERLNNHFPNRIKDSILQEAIQGKLILQDSNDEPAIVLLERIKEEKEQLIREKKIKSNKNESVIFKENNHFYEKIGKNEPICIDDEIPFNIPNSWEWCRLNTVVTILGDGIHGTPNYDDNGDYYFINGNNLNNGEITIKENTKKVNYEEYLKHYRELNENTVLVSINGTIGNIAFYNNEKVMLGKSACYFNLFKRILKNYIKILVESDYFMKYALNSATGTTIKNVSLKSMKNWLIPIPPYEEQKRIVRKIEDLELYRK